MAEVLSQSEFEEILRKVKDALDKLEPLWNEMVKAVTEAAKDAWGWLVDKIKAGLKFLWEWIAKIITEVDKFYFQPGVPWTLWTHGTSWTDDVGAKASHWQDTMQISQLKTDDEWKGAAANAYKDILPLQQKALGAIKKATDKIDTILTNHAIAIGVAWLAIAAGLVSFIIELSGELAGVSTIAAALAAIAAAIVSCAKVWAIITGALAVLEGVLAALLPSLRELDQELTSSEGFPQGSWPKFTRDIANASMKDDDNDPKTEDADWELSRY